MLNHLSEESIQLLRNLSRTCGRLHGRFDRDVPFRRTDPDNPDTDWSEAVPVSVVEELFEAAFIRIDEAAAPGDTYTFQISAEGQEYLTATRGNSSHAGTD